MINAEETPKKKDTVRISKKDLLKLLSENEHLTQQVKDLQSLCNEYLEETRALKQKIIELEAKKVIENMTPLAPENVFQPLKPSTGGSRPRRDIYFDGK